MVRTAAKTVAHKGLCSERPFWLKLAFRASFSLVRFFWRSKRNEHIIRELRTEKRRYLHHRIKHKVHPVVITITKKLLMKYILISWILFVSLNLSAQDCTETSILQKPGIWKRYERLSVGHTGN